MSAYDDVVTARVAREAALAARQAEIYAAGAVPTGSHNVNDEVDSYTLALSDAGKTVVITKGSAVNATVPPNASVAFPIGTKVTLVQGGAGRMTVVAGSGVTVSAAVGLLSVGAGGVVNLVKTATNVWRAEGDLAAS